MIDKTLTTCAEAVADIGDGATVMIGGFGTAGMPDELIDALIAHGAKELTIVNNNAGNGDSGLAALIANKRVKRIVCSFPRQSDSWHFDAAYKAGEIELELVPQGNLAARIHAAGNGLGRSSPRLAMAPNWPKARKPGRSTAGITCSSTRSAPISP